MSISRDPNIQGVVRITSDTLGPHVVMCSGIHGDEVSGIHAIEKVLFDFSGARERCCEALSPSFAPMSRRLPRSGDMSSTT